MWGGGGRNSSVELLKIIAVFLIVLSHCSPAVGDKSEWASFVQTSLSTTSVQRIIIVLFTYGGQIGNAIFVICSSWFLVEHSQNSYKKILGMVFDTWVISVMFLLLSLITGVPLTNKIIAQYLLPITFNNNWFVSCYLIFYLVHPLLNRIIETSIKQQLFKIVFISSCIYGGVQILMPWRYYYNELVGFIVLYFVTAYVKKYKKTFSIQTALKVFAGSLTALIVLILITNIIGLRIDIFSNQLLRWNTFINPLIVMMVISLLRIFLYIDFSSRLINRISSVSLIVYLLHYNIYTAGNIIPVWFTYIYNSYSYKFLVPGALILAGILFLSTEFLAQLYRVATFHIRDKITDCGLNIIRTIYHLIYEKINDIFMRGIEK